MQSGVVQFKRKSITSPSGGSRNLRTMQISIPTKSAVCLCESCIDSTVGSVVKLQAPTILVHFKKNALFQCDLNRLLLNMYVMVQIYPQFRATTRIWRRGSTLWYHQIFSVGHPSRSQLKAARGDGERCELSPAGFGAKPQTLTILVHFRMKRGSI